MAEFNNINTLIANEAKENSSRCYDSKMTLPGFTTTGYLYRKLGNRLPGLSLLSQIKNHGKNYIFKYNGKKYKFSVFSEQDIQKSDKKRLKNIKERNLLSLVRSLKLACSMDLVDPKIVLGKSSLSNLELFISYYTSDGEKIIDYSRNIMMDKTDYYDMLGIE